MCYPSEQMTSCCIHTIHMQLHACAVLSLPLQSFTASLGTRKLSLPLCFALCMGILWSPKIIRNTNVLSSSNDCILCKRAVSVIRFLQQLKPQFIKCCAAISHDGN